jgi:hypothetical protein
MEHLESCEYYYFPLTQKIPLHKLSCNCLSPRDKIILECIHKVANGQTVANLGHDPNVRRALEWVIAELRDLRKKDKEAA